MAGDDGDLRDASIGEVSPKLPTTAEELLVRYADGERTFAGANLRDAILDDADLRDVVLQGADLTGASFRRAALERGDFTKTKGLLPRALAGADLRGVQLPDSLKEFADLARAKGL